MDEKKGKAGESKLPDELTELCSKEGVELPDELLDVIAGGALSKREADELEKFLRESGVSMGTTQYLLWRLGCGTSSAN